MQWQTKSNFYFCSPSKKVEENVGEGLQSQTSECWGAAELHVPGRWLHWKHWWRWGELMFVRPLLPNKQAYIFWLKPEWKAFVLLWIMTTLPFVWVEHNWQVYLGHWLNDWTIISGDHAIRIFNHAYYCWSCEIFNFDWELLWCVISSSDRCIFLACLLWAVEIYYEIKRARESGHKTVNLRGILLDPQSHIWA